MTAHLLLDGRYVVPENHTDLLDGQWPVEPPLVSVVIPYYRDQARLDLVLTGLTLQTHPLTRLEVVIADDGSPQPPGVRAAGTQLAVSLVRQPDQGFRAAAARNLGARAAGGAVLCFLDGDTVPAPGYIRALSRLPALLPDAFVTGHRRHAELGACTPDRLRRWLGGSGPAPPLLAEPQWLLDVHRNTQNLLRLDRHSYRAVISAVLGCAASLFAELGGFDDTFTAYGGEDWELGYRALNAGAVLAHEPAAVAWHNGPDWGARQQDPGAAESVKAHETAALAALIPGIGPIGTGPADVCITVIAQPDVGAEAAQAYRADQDLDCVVAECDRSSPSRVHVQVTATAGFPAAAELRGLVERVSPGQLGRVTLTAPGRWRAVALSMAAVRRTHRWRHEIASPDLLADLYGADDAETR